MNISSSNLSNFLSPFILLFLLIFGNYSFSDMPAKKQIEVNMMNGEKHTASVLCITDSLLVLWDSDKPYDNSGLNDYTTIIHACEIDRIHIESKSNILAKIGKGFLGGALSGLAISAILTDPDEPFAGIGYIAGTGGGALTGMIIGGIAGIVKDQDYDFRIRGNSKMYKEVHPVLINYAMFRGSSPAELQAYIKNNSKNIRLQLAASKKVRERNNNKSSSKLSKFHISLASVWTKTGTDNMMSAFKRSGFGGYYPGGYGFLGYYPPRSYPEDISTSPFSVNVGVEYNITRNFRLGYAQVKIPKREVEGMEGELENAGGKSYSILFDYVPSPVTYLLTKRAEIFIGAGISYSRLKANVIIAEGSTGSFLIKQSAIGVHVRTGLDFYISRNLSVKLKVDGRIIPAMDVPEINYFNIKTLKSHTINFSAIDVSIGLGVHL